MAENNFPFEQFFSLNQNQANSPTKSAPLSPSALILENLRESIPKEQFTTYFERVLELKDDNGSIATFEVTTDFMKTMIEGHFKDFIKNSVEKTLGPRSIIIETKKEKNHQSKSSNFSNIFKSLESQIATPADKPAQETNNANGYKFTLDLNESHEDLVQKAESQYLTQVKGSSLGIIIDPLKTFDDFIVGHSNNLAFATAKIVAQHPNRPSKPGRYPSLYIHSASGLGKTHLLHAVANEIRENFPELTICLTTAREFMREMIKSIKENTLPDFQRRYSEKLDVLIIDDIHELENKGGTQNEFFHIFNELHNKGRQLIFTSDKLPSEIQGIAERIKTRLSWGLVVDIQKPDFETRVAIVKQKAEKLDLFLSEDIFYYIAREIKNSVRELEGALMRLSAYAEVMKMELDLKTAITLLQLNKQINSDAVSLEKIASQVSNYLHVPQPDLLGRSRQKEIVHARHIAMFLAQNLTNKTLNDIGIFFGGRDHTSVLHGVKKIDALISSNQEVSRAIEQIKSNLT